MATIKVYNSTGVKELVCFDTLDLVDYLDPEEEVEVEEVPDRNPFA